MTLWNVHDGDGEIVATDVESDTVAGALAQFRYAETSWYATPCMEEDREGE